LDLQSLNLIHPNTVEQTHKLKIDCVTHKKICGKWFAFKATKDNPKLIGLYKLTSSGQNLLKFIHLKENKIYIDWSIDWFKKSGLEYVDSTSIKN
jgi:hypothetical protein